MSQSKEKKEDKAPFSFSKLVKDVKEELYKNFVKFLVVFLVGIFVALFGLDHVTERFKKWNENRKAPARLVYYCGCTTSSYTLDSLSNVEIKFVGENGTMTLSDSLGQYCFFRKEKIGVKKYTLVATKTGYTPSYYPEVPAPLEEGDTTFINIQLDLAQKNLPLVNN